MGRLFTTFLAMFSFLVYYTSAIHTTPLISSNQIKFWSENVQNKMPTSIFNKLSPLTQNQCDFYTKMFDSNNVRLQTDSSFCSLAKLSCGAAALHIMIRGNAYTQNQYTNNPAAATLSHEDPFSFFRISNLKNGNSVRLPDLRDSLPDRAFLPHQIASRIPLNVQEITRLFPGSSTELEAIKYTLSYCNAASIKGEVKRCPRSLEEMVDFSKSALGGGKKIISLTSKSTQGSSTRVTIKNVKKFNTDKIVACHESFLPFAAYFCHSLSSTSLYSVDLVEPETGAPVNTLLAICHMDTSPWPENHVAFKILNLKPGQGEACHWFSKIDLAWIPDTGSV